MRDGLVILATGKQATPDVLHQRSDFPAYWNLAMRQYLYYDGHNGYDFNLTYQPVYAAASGKVIYANWEYSGLPDHGYGRMVMIEHRHGYVTLYGHLSKFLVKRGQKVKIGQKIAISGNTGHSTGPHLHFTVFHNCTPTDPYGWTGGGPDPLSTFQGETSEYLWLKQPLVDNPAPGWPGLSSLPTPPGERIALLRLPSTRGGAGAFTQALHQEAEAARKALRATGATVSIDTLRGALLVTGDVSASQLYALPSVASISSPGTVEGDRQDVLQALARASLVTRHQRLAIGHSHRWNGYLLQWDGRTILVGKGEKGRQIRLSFSSGRGGSQLRSVQADPKTGAYAVDLGALSGSEYAQLLKRLTAENKPSVPPVVQPVRQHNPVPAPARKAVTPGGDVTSWLLLAAVLAAGAVAGLTGVRRRVGMRS